VTASSRWIGPLRCLVGAATCLAFASCALISGLDAFVLDDRASTDASGGGGHGGGGGDGGGGGGGGGGCPEENCDDGNPCTTESCAAGACDAPMPTAVGTTCSGGVCDGMGTCAPCDGGVGGAGSGGAGASTGLCLGAACGMPGDCAGGVCVDGRCCSTDCTGACQSCAVLGQEGLCVPLLKGLTEEPTCVDQTGCGAVDPQVCVCDPAPPAPSCTPTALMPLGGKCTTTAECFGGICAMGTCRLVEGEPCDDDAACASNRCFEERCQACNVGTDCESGQCEGGKCKGDWGQPCGDEADCAGGQCSASLCKKLSGACSDNIECVVNLCSGGNCSPCNDPSLPCGAGSGQCTNGACNLVIGDYCFVDNQCAGTDCGGFPMKCR